ncbi:MlaA family lipoprotein [Pseudohalioglobus lutimaris]|nr:VacJ family lipoprotein [Pseudohalioglobus lutimaris]
MNVSRLLLLCLLALPLPMATAAEPERNPDPLEAINRPLFELNNKLDQYFLRPVAQGYDWVMPGFAKRGVGNMFANMYDFNSAINGVLQGRFVGAAQGGGRFLVNSTLGLAGLFDVATPMGIRPYRTDFGHTLAIWGFESGPYLMVPFFGPRTVRSGTGTVFDVYTSIPTYIDNVPVRNSLFGLELIDGRARLLQADELLSGDAYIFIRDAYLQQRETFVNDGVVQDDFSDFGDEEDWEEF